MAFGDRVTAQDFNTLAAAGNDTLNGIWSDGVTMWVHDGRDRKLYAYNLITKARDPGKDFDSRIWCDGGIWSDGTYVWTSLSFGSISERDRLYAWNLSTEARYTAGDFATLAAAGNRSPYGIWSDGTTMWVSDEVDDKIYAYNMRTKARDASKDFNTLIAAGIHSPEAIWSNGTTMWVVAQATVGGRRIARIFAFNLATKARDADKDIAIRGGEIPTGLWGNSQYLWTAQTIGDNIIAYSLEVVVTPPAPGKPTGLTGTAGNAIATLGWTATAGATAYDIEYKWPGVNFRALANNITTNAYIARNLINGRAYTFRVRAENSGGNSPWSDEITVTPVAPLPVPGVPTSFTASEDDGQTNLRWATAAGVASWEIQMKETSQGAASWAFIVQGRTVNAWLQTGLTNRVSYDFRIRARNASGVSAWSATISVTPVGVAPETPPIVIPEPPVVVPPPQEPPPIPGSLMATPLTQAMGLVWIEAPRSASYDVRYRQVVADLGTVPWTIVTGFPNEAAMIAGLLEGVEYEFAVRAVNAFGESLWTESVRGTPPVPTRPPDRVPALRTTAGNGQVGLGWDLADRATSYEIEQRAGAGNYMAAGEFSAADRPVWIIELINGQAYTFRIRAKNSAGVSGWTEATATPEQGLGTIPEELLDVRLTEGNQKLTVHWNDPNGGGQIQIRHREKDGSWNLGAQLRGQYDPYEITGLTNGQEYEVQARAWNLLGNSPWSAIAEGTPRAAHVASFAMGIQRERAIIMKLENDAMGLCSGGQEITLGNFARYGAFKNLSYSPWIQIASEVGSESAAASSASPSIQVKIPNELLEDWTSRRKTGEEVRAAYIERFNPRDPWILTEYGFVGLLDRFEQYAESFNFTLLSVLERVTKEDAEIWSDHAHQTEFEGDVWFSRIADLSRRGRYVKFP